MLPLKWLDIVWIGLFASTGFNLLFVKNFFWHQVVFPTLMGLFIIILNKRLSDEFKEYYIRQSKKFSLLWPPQWINKISWRFQRFLTIFVGVAFFVGGIYNYLVIY